MGQLLPFLPATLPLVTAYVHPYGQFIKRPFIELGMLRIVEKPVRASFLCSFSYMFINIHCLH